MKVSTIGIMLLIAVGVSCAWGFEIPNGDQIKNVAENPTAIAPLIKNATAEEAADVVVAVVREIDGMKISLEEKQKRVEELFVAVQTAWGDKAMILLAMTADRVNPELLPVVATVGSQRGAPPPAPPVANRYIGQ